jgi:hypothetical protein
MKSIFRRVRNTPLFPIVPFVPIVIGGGMIALEIFMLRRLLRLERSLTLSAA